VEEFVCEVCAVRFTSRREQWPRTRGWPLTSSCATDMERDVRCVPVPYRVDKGAQRDLHVRAPKAFPKNSRDRSGTHLSNEAAAGVVAEVVVLCRALPIGAGGGGAAVVGGGGIFSGSVASVTPTAEAVTMREHYSLWNFRITSTGPLKTTGAGYGWRHVCCTTACPSESRLQKRYVRVIGLL